MVHRYCISSEKRGSKWRIHLCYVWVEFVITNWHFRKTRAFPESQDIAESHPFFREVTSELKKMAESSLMRADILHFCSNEHVPTETVSTDRYKLMCRMHVPVYLFADARDDMFLMYHFHVGIYVFNCFLKINLNCFLVQINWENVVISFFLFGKKDVDETHRVMAVYICTRCGQTFHRGDELDVIRDHLVKCTIRVPAFLRTCRFCGLVSLFHFHYKRMYTCTFNFFHHKWFPENVKGIYVFFLIWTGHH